jgi:hypothetical protein
MIILGTGPGQTWERDMNEKEEGLAAFGPVPEGSGVGGILL